MTGELANRKLSSVLLIRHLHRLVYRVEIFRDTYNVNSIFCQYIDVLKIFYDPIPFGSLDS